MSLTAMDPQRAPAPKPATVDVFVNDPRATVLAEVLLRTLRAHPGGPWRVTLRHQPHEPQRWGLEVVSGGRAVLTLVYSDDPPRTIAARVLQLLETHDGGRSVS